MRTLKLISAAGLALCLTPAAHAQTSSGEAVRLTILTFSEPVQLPGVTLPAGKYRFEMEGLNTTGHTVMVRIADDNKIVGLFKTISTTDTTRDLRDTDVVVMWSERPAGQPQALREWYYPQRSTGEEFVYPKGQAMAIAAANNASVPTEEDGKIVRIGGADGASESTTAAAAPAASQAPTTSAPAPAPAPESTIAQRPMPEPTSVGTSGQAPTEQTAERRLPRTASSLGLVGLLSAFSLTAALGVRRLRLRAARG